MSGILRVLSSSNLAVNISLKHKSSWTLTTWFYVVISKKKYCFISKQNILLQFSKSGDEVPLES